MQGGLAERRSFWTGYQPGLRQTQAREGTPDFFRAVERRRYALEPHIAALARFGDWAGRDVLEAGCGMATDGAQFARAGASYTGADFSPRALELAQQRFELDGLQGRFVRASIAELPFEDASFDLVYSFGVIHHLPETERVVSEFHRVLRPGGTAIVMVYHRDSLNYRFSIMALRRALAGLMLVPGAAGAVSRLSGERRDVLEGHRELLARHGAHYLRDRQLFLSNNTDGPGNPLSKVYSRAQARALFGAFDEVRTDVHWLNLRVYPAGERFDRSTLGQRLGRRWGWHLTVTARKAGAAA
jgi:SAM-dependent methyltransferase